MVFKERNSYCNPSYAPPKGSNARIGRRQRTKQYSNNNQITKIYFQITFDFTWYTTSAFTAKDFTAVHGFLFSPRDCAFHLRNDATVYASFRFDLNEAAKCVDIDMPLVLQACKMGGLI